MLTDDSRPPYFESFSERELGDKGRHREWAGAYGEVKWLRDFLAHNMRLKVLPEEEHLTVNTFYGSPPRQWMDENPNRLDIAFMSRAAEVADWLLDVVVWTTWQVGLHGSWVAATVAGEPFDEHNPPEFGPPHVLGVPLR